MSQPDAPGQRAACHCGALIQHSWWHEILENEDYQVVRVDTVNSVADILTFEIVPGTESRHPLFLSVAEIDWPALVANFAEPVLTRNGKDAALVVHEILLARLRELLALDDRNAAKYQNVTVTSAMNRGRSASD